MMHAYDDSYLPGAQRNLGEAFEYAILACGVGADEFSDRFIASGLALEWEEASPRVLAGISGTELARDALSWTSRPSAVSTSLRPERSKSFTPSRSSMSETACEIAGCVMKSTFAAWVMLPVRATW